MVGVPTSFLPRHQEGGVEIEVDEQQVGGDKNSDDLLRGGEGDKEMKDEVEGRVTRDRESDRKIRKY